MAVRWAEGCVARVRVPSTHNPVDSPDGDNVPVVLVDAFPRGKPNEPGAPLDPIILRSITGDELFLHVQTLLSDRKVAFCDRLLRVMDSLRQVEQSYSDQRKSLVVFMDWVDSVMWCVTKQLGHTLPAVNEILSSSAIIQTLVEYLVARLKLRGPSDIEHIVHTARSISKIPSLGHAEACMCALARATSATRSPVITRTYASLRGGQSACLEALTPPQPDIVSIALRTRKFDVVAKCVAVEEDGRGSHSIGHESTRGLIDWELDRDLCDLIADPGHSDLASAFNELNRDVRDRLVALYTKRRKCG